MTPLDRDTRWMTKAEIERKISWVDTVYIEDAQPPHDLIRTITEHVLDVNQFISIRPYEKWTLDDSLKLVREVIGYTSVCENLSPITKEVRGWEPFFYVSSDMPAGTAKKIATIRYQQPIKRDIDWYIENLETSVRYKLFEPIFRKAWDGSLKVYSSPEISSLLNKEQRETDLCSVDTTYIESPFEPYDLKMTVIEECPSLFYDQVVAIEFIQDIYLYENMAISIDVKWYAPVVEDVDRTNGKVRGNKALYWIRN